MAPSFVSLDEFIVRLLPGKARLRRLEALREHRERATTSVGDVGR